jgi:hypothetical protein
VHWWALDHDDTLYCEREYTFQEKTDAEVAKRIREIETDMKLWKGHQSAITGPADTQLWEERGESSRSKAAVMASLGVNWVRADKKSRRHNSERLMKRLLDHQHGTKPPGIVFFRTCKQAITTIPAIQTDPKDTEVPEDGGDDHWLDSVLYATAHASHGKKGIARHALDDDFEDEDDEKEEKRTRGNYGYGGY